LPECQNSPSPRQRAKEDVFCANRGFRNSQSRSAVVLASSPALFKIDQHHFFLGHHFARAGNWTSFVSGHNLSRAEEANNLDWALAPAGFVLGTAKNPSEPITGESR
jgi:hypothetical protein